MATATQRTSVSHLDTSSICSHQPSTNVDKVVQSVTNATKRLSQISTSTNTSSKKRKSQNKIGPWKLGRTLGRGSTGRVRLAKNVETGQLAAVKIVPKSNFKKLENPKYKRYSNELEGDDEATQRLPYGIEREIIIMKLISHPNIMGLYDVWENKNDLYLILEYIEGGELFDYLIKKGRLHESEAINYFKQIINGINYLHQFNICHRDLKPENLLLDFNKNIKIADFGMAALEIKEKLLETSCGSPHYASPEIVAGKNYHGAPSDIWSCGIILFALLTGHLPFDDENIRKLLLKVQSGKFTMPHDLSWEAKDLISKMLKVNPSDRIAIESILSHPLLTKYPDPQVSYANSTTLDLRSAIIKPISSNFEIDKEILKNLSVLFHNCDEKTIISKLMSPNRCPEKMFYYLLMKYRNEHFSKKSHSEQSGSRDRSLPRSTSMVQTTIYNDTGEPIAKTRSRVKKLTESPSVYSNISVNSSKTPLRNITNKQSRQFSASNSFNKNRSSSHNRSRLPSTVSLKSNLSKIRSASSPTPAKNYTLEKTHSNNNNNSNLQRLARHQPSSGSGVPLNKKIRSSANDAKEARTPKSKNGDHFINSLDDFDEEQEKENIPTRETGSTTTSTTNRKEESALARKERELAEKVRQRNEEREQRIQMEDQIKRELEEQRTRLEERKRKIALEEQELLVRQNLQERQKLALEKLKKRNSGNDFETFLERNRRSATIEPVPMRSSLDPRQSSLSRASTLNTPSRTRYHTVHSPQVSENTSKVLHKLGIEVAPSPRKFDASFKTSSSRNLSGVLKNTAKTKGQNMKTSSSRHLFDYLHASKANDAMSVEEFNEIENPQPSRTLSMSSSLNRTSQSTDQSTDQSTYHSTDKSTLVDIEVVDQTENATTSEENMDQTTSLIPNPRFSRFSFGGLLKSSTTTNEVGDITIMTQTMQHSNTVIRRPHKSHSNFTGLGIQVRNTINEDEDEEKEEVEVEEEVEEKKESDKKLVDTRGDSPLEDDPSDATTIESRYSFVASEFLHTSNSQQSETNLSINVISSPPSQQPSRVDSKETLIRRSSDDTIQGEHVRDSFAAQVNNADDYYSIAEHSKSSSIQEPPLFESPLSPPPAAAGHSPAGVQDDKGGALKEARLSTAIFSTASNKSPRVQLPPNDNDGGGSPASDTIDVKRQSTLGYRTSIMRNPIVDTPPEPKETSLFRRLSKAPKRSAPPAPNSAQPMPGHYRFSRTSGASKPLEKQEPTKSNWFKKFFQSLTSSKQPHSKNKVPISNRYIGKDIKILDSSLRSAHLIRVIKDQMELKELEGSLTKVSIDEEFGLITGTIPSKFSHGRKLKFRMEMIDLITSSSLHIMKVKGPDKSFQNFTKVVSYVIRKEEQIQS
ncbi:uncharacterized protein LODBEIA_P53420 [Lodderomyces beijingensis]|uniref:non-specific serine/threonine protein kinase n=1 Tax=Lodderomyces beijingensis TaxID=1775926 RepID=A0ABP0ZTY2_9ASCO